MSQLPQQGFAQGAGGFPPAPPLSRDNPGQLVPARPGSLPGALPARGAPGAKLSRGTVPVSAAAAAGLVNGLPFATGGLPTPPPPAIEEPRAAPVVVPGMVGAAVVPPAVVLSPIAAPLIVSAPVVPAIVTPIPQALPFASTPAPPEVVPPARVAPIAQATPPTPLADVPPPPPVVSGFAPVAKPSQPAMVSPVAANAIGSISGSAIPVVVGQSGAPIAAIAAAPIASASAPPAVASASAPPMVTPTMGTPAVVSDPPMRSDAPIAQPSGAPANGASGDGHDGEPASTASPWMMEKALPPPPVFTPAPASKPPVALVESKSSKAPFIVIALLLVLGGGGFAAWRFTQGSIAKKKVDDGALKIEAPTAATAKTSDDNAAPAETTSARPPPQLATGTVPTVPTTPVTAPTGASTVPHERPPTPAQPPPPSNGGKFDPQGI